MPPKPRNFALSVLSSASAPAGRGTGHNPPNRFESAHAAPNPDGCVTDPTDVLPRTQVLADHSRTILTCNDSPDVPFDVSLNPYRGCEHGCIYCFARPTHEYLGYSSGLDFETRILVKYDAPNLLRRALAASRYVPRHIAFSSVTDPYQPLERKLRITRGCLEVLAACRHPVSIISKNHLVTRDLDLLAALAQHHAVLVMLSITTLDPDLTRIMEPRTSVPRDRLAAIAALVAAGVPVGVMVAPVIAGLTDHEMPAILAAARAAGATFAGFQPVRLPLSVAALFEHWLAEHFPERQAKILGRLREVPGGPCGGPLGQRMTGQGAYASQLFALFEVACRREGYTHGPKLSAASFVPPVLPGTQLRLFG
jgi:DNA repair photolyase